MGWGFSWDFYFNLATCFLKCFRQSFWDVLAICLHEEHLLPTSKQDWCWHFWRGWQNVWPRAQRLLSWPRRDEWLAMKYMGINGASQKQASFRPASPAKVGEGDSGSLGRRGLNSRSERGERHRAQWSYTAGSSDNSWQAPRQWLGKTGTTTTYFPPVFVRRGAWQSMSKTLNS